MFHLRFDPCFGHGVCETKRTSAYCYEAFALRVAGHSPEQLVIDRCKALKNERSLNMKMYLRAPVQLGEQRKQSTLRAAVPPPRHPQRAVAPIQLTQWRARSSRQPRIKLGIYGRAVRAVWSILRTYYPTEAAKVAAVVYSEGVQGLRTTRAGTGPTATGIITVGRTFVEHTTDRFFARRVLQVGHELRHIDQYRAGMIGPANKAKREFLAHSWTAFARKSQAPAVWPERLAWILSIALWLIAIA
jgi:hypothetical protein